MAVKVAGNWFIYLYCSDSIVGTVAQNNAGEVPLSAFPSGSLASGVPKTPEWLKIEIYSMFPKDIGNRDTVRRAGGVTATIGSGQWGGTMHILEYDFNETLAQYFDLYKKLRKDYVYIWFNDYDGGEYLISDVATSAMRIVFSNVAPDNEEDAYRAVIAEWRKYCEGL